MTGQLGGLDMHSKMIFARTVRPLADLWAGLFLALAIAVLPSLVLADAAAARPPSGGSVHAATQGGLFIKAEEVAEPAIPSAAQTVVTLPAGRTGRSYHRRLIGLGGTQPHRFSLESGSLPAGLALSEDGVLAGTPTAAGDWNFSARVMDGARQSTTQLYHLRIVGTASLRH